LFPVEGAGHDLKAAGELAAELLLRLRGLAAGR
jgi:hypothetical protein